MDTTLNVAGMDYFHLYLFVKALRTLGLSINRQNCWGSFDPNQKVMKNSIRCISFSHIEECMRKTTLFCNAFYIFIIKRDLGNISKLCKMYLIIGP